MEMRDDEGSLLDASGSVLAFAGKKSAIPPPRDRTPDPIRSVVSGRSAPKPPAPYRNFDVQLSRVDVVYAEDEPLFRETAVRQLVEAGFKKENIYQSENGLGALEDLLKLQFQGNMTMPLVVLLDIMMPGMDGRECALQIQELVKKHHLLREPFVICCSSSHQRVIVQEGKGNFQVVLPKPFTQEHTTVIADLITRWWTTGQCRSLPAWKTFSREDIDVIVADDEPVSSMHAVVAFQQAGVPAEHISEVEDAAKLRDMLAKMQEKASQSPVVLVMRQQWTENTKRVLDESLEGKKDQPFLICCSESEDFENTKVSEAVLYFDAFLPFKFGKREVEWCLELLRLWWLTRGEGPEEVDSESDPPSEGED